MSSAQTDGRATTHHIQCLTITDNFALLAGINPHKLHAWYLAIYADALEWGEAPNTLGMSQFADAGLVGSKPSAASGAYINRMSDYFGYCFYRVKDKLGERACPLNALYWDFVARNTDRFAKNPRMAQIVRSWRTMAPDQQNARRRQAGEFLASFVSPEATPKVRRALRCAPATLGAVLHTVPVTRPLLAPGKRLAAGRARFLRQVLLRGLVACRRLTRSTRHLLRSFSHRPQRYASAIRLRSTRAPSIVAIR
jgi:hypothetical protein